MIPPSSAVSRYRRTIALAYEAPGTERKRAMNDPAGRRAGAHTLSTWWLRAPSSATASSPCRISKTVQPFIRPLLPEDRSARQRVRAQLDVHGARLAALAALHQPRRAIAVGAPQPAPFPARVRI